MWINLMLTIDLRTFLNLWNTWSELHLLECSMYNSFLHTNSNARRAFTYSRCIIWAARAKRRVPRKITGMIRRVLKEKRNRLGGNVFNLATAFSVSKCSVKYIRGSSVQNVRVILRWEKEKKVCRCFTCHETHLLTKQVGLIEHGARMNHPVAVCRRVNSPMHLS